MPSVDRFLRKADLHVHTPKSVCYNRPGVNAHDIVHAALAAGLDILGITDHNSVSGIDDIRKAAEGTGLTVLPGVELTTSDGHFLALFEPHVTTVDLEDFLDFSGIERIGRGDARTVSSDVTLAVMKKVHERAGIVIAAHIDRWPSGFMEAKTGRRYKVEIHGNEYLDALEITIPGNRLAWNTGQVRDFPLKRACVQGSDAHNPGEIGRRPVYIRMDRINLAELKEAFLDCGHRILFQDEEALEK